MDELKRLQRSIGESSTLLTTPYDPELWRQAKEVAGHISIKAVSDEYDRLVLAKYQQRRSWWSRLLWG
jgi:hypothetical protein